MTLSTSLTDLQVDESIQLEQQGSILTLWLNRPESRNAMSLNMVNAIQQVFAHIADDVSIRAVILRGKGGHFCAGGDIKDMAALRVEAANVGSLQPYVDFNRRFGAMIEQVDQAPQTVVAILEGAVLGGGFGLACVSDIALADHQAQFGLPETSLGLLPAQIAPFVVQRIGLTQTRRLALTAARFNGLEAHRLGLVHFVEHDPQALAERLDAVLVDVLRCAPGANAVTKALLLASTEQPLGPLLDQAAEWFSTAVTGAEGIEGTLAFVQKRKPNWVS